MPPEYATGLVGTIFTAPRLRDTLGATMKLLSNDSLPYDKPGTPGVGHDELQRFIIAAKADLLEPPPKPERLLKTSLDATSGRTILNRPRTALELLREVALTEDPAFANEGPPLLVVRRDPRGVASIAKKDGRIPAPFVDANNDGLPDLDSLGRFVLTPNATPPPDPFSGEDRSALYEYIDARKTAASAAIRHVAPLADPDGGKESLLAAAEGLEVLVRDPEGREAILDLVYAASQLMADRGTDELLSLFAKLFKDDPQLMARVTGNLLDAKAVLDAHPEAEIPADSTVLDDLLTVVVKIGRQPGLLEETLGALADDRSLHLSKALPALLSFRDRVTYDPGAINGLPINLTTGGSVPETPVDRSLPNTGWNRSLWQRFLAMIAETKGVSVCNKQNALLWAQLHLEGQGWIEAPYPFSGVPEAPECEILWIDNLSKFYLRSIVGKAEINLRVEFLALQASPEALMRSTGIEGFFPSKPGEALLPSPRFLNRLAFFKANKDAIPSDVDYKTHRAIGNLQDTVGSAACAEYSVDDPVSALDPKPKIPGLRKCAPGQTLGERAGDTIFGLEFFHAYDAIAPLTEVFVKHKQEDLLLELLDVLNKHWSVPGGIAKAEPALAEIFSGDLVASLAELTKATKKVSLTRCADTSIASCDSAATIPAVLALTDGLRALVDPAVAERTGLADRRGNKKSANGRPITLFGMFRDALNAEDRVFAKTPAKQRQWVGARSRIVDEFLAINGRGAEAKFADPGIPQLVPVIVNLLRSQRLAKCEGTVECPAIRQQMTKDVDETINSTLLKAALDLFDVILRDPSARREIGRLTAYMTRQEAALGGASTAPSSTPFATSKARAPGALDQSIAALVDALGALGHLEAVRPFYPVLAGALDHIDPQLALLSRLNARAFDGQGHEICAKELDPEEAIRNTLARLSMTVVPAGGKKQSVLQIFLDAIADVNRVDAADGAPMDANDYAHVFKNVHELLSDPKSGLEQLYASVKQAAEH
jgi:hypothetical protein